jgi:hypothetical protein
MWSATAVARAIDLDGWAASRSADRRARWVTALRPSVSCRACHLFAAPCMCTCESPAPRVASTARDRSWSSVESARRSGTVWGELYGLVVGQGSGAYLPCRAGRRGW